MEKKSFIIYNSYYEPIKYLNNESLGRLFRAIFEYQIFQKEDVDDDIRMAFEFFKNQFKIDSLKYEQICEKNRKNGLKGGRPKKRDKNPKKPSVILKPKKADNDNDNDNDITTDIYTYLENNFARTLSPIEIDKISQWLSLYEENIIKYAIELSVLNGKKTFNYVEGILKNWKGHNFNSLDEILEHEKSKNKNNKVLSDTFSTEGRRFFT